MKTFILAALAPALSSSLAIESRASIAQHECCFNMQPALYTPSRAGSLSPPSRGSAGPAVPPAQLAASDADAAVATGRFCLSKQPEPAGVLRSSATSCVPAFNPATHQLACSAPEARSFNTYWALAAVAGTDAGVLTYADGQDFLARCYEDGGSVGFFDASRLGEPGCLPYRLVLSEEPAPGCTLGVMDQQAPPAKRGDVYEPKEIYEPKEVENLGPSDW